MQLTMALDRDVCYDCSGRRDTLLDDGAGVGGLAHWSANH